MSSCFGKGIFVFRNSAKNAGDHWKQVKASRLLADDTRVTSDGRADRCAVFGEYARRF